MDKRYQVFVSSTYDDLQEERQQVMQALLELDSIPSGMELFPAANDDQWTLIKKVIDDCDYYLVIIAGRYGSIDSAGMSFTEMEYRYALEQGKPVIAFLHKDPTGIPAKFTEQSPEGKVKLEAFRSFVQQKMVKFWTSPAELGSVVSRSLVKLMKDNPAVGWVRADRLASQNASLVETLNLRRRIDELEAILTVSQTQTPQGTENLAQGDDPVIITFDYSAFVPATFSGTRYSSQHVSTWNEIFSAVSPLLIGEASESNIKRHLTKLVEEANLEMLSNRKEFKGLSLRNFTISEESFQTVKVQLRALGLIAKSDKQRSLRDADTYWTLTPFGDGLITRLRAIKKAAFPIGSTKREALNQTKKVKK